MIPTTGLKCIICEYFEECRSLKKTAEYFSYENIVQCGNDLIEFFGSSEPLEDAKDYKEFCKLDGRYDSSSEDE